MKVGRVNPYRWRNAMICDAMVEMAKTNIAGEVMWGSLEYKSGLGR